MPTGHASNHIGRQSKPCTWKWLNVATHGRWPMARVITLIDLSAQTRLMMNRHGMSEKPLRIQIGDEEYDATGVIVWDSTKDCFYLRGERRDGQQEETRSDHH